MMPTPLHPSHPIPVSARPLPPSSAALPTSSTAPPLVVTSSSAAPPPPPPPPAALPQSYTTQLSDLLLSAVVPGIPKGAKKPFRADEAGRKRPLTSKKEELNLTSTTNNFRKFVLKVGWLFVLQDRAEEVIFWHKPEQSVLFLLCWTLISFYPHLIFLAPPILLLSFLVSPYQQIPSMTNHGRRRSSTYLDDAAPGVASPTSSHRELSPTPNSGSQHGQSGTFSLAERLGNATSGEKRTERRGSGSHIGRLHGDLNAAQSLQQSRAVEERKIEAGLSAIYYQNIQGIQNLMGMFSDLHDTVAPTLSSLLAPSHPLHETFVALSLLLFVGLAFAGPYIPLWTVLLPAGWIPLLIGLIPPAVTIPIPPPALAQPLSTLHRHVLDDRIPCGLRDLERCEVSVWENQRWKKDAKEPAGGTWENRKWSEREIGSLIGGEEIESLQSLSLPDAWIWIPGEEWFVDRVGGWIESGVDHEGWSYTSPHHQMPSPHPASTSDGLEDIEGGTLRRRRWWRRGVRVD